MQSTSFRLLLNMTWAITIAGFLILAYGSVVLLVYLLQDLFFFRPEILPPDFRYAYAFSHEELDFDMEDGGRINAVLFKVPNSRGVVFYFKGNSRSIKGWGKFSKDFLANGYDIFMMDYRGFGKSRGRRTEQNLYNDAQYLYIWLRDRYPEHHMVLYGRSLGSGIAARIASWNKPLALILDSPYYSFYHHLRKYAFMLPLKRILRFQIRTDQYLKKLSCPVFIVHGTKDRLINFSNSLKLKELAPDKVRLTAVEGAGHNNLPDFASFHRFLYDVLDEISPKNV